MNSLFWIKKSKTGEVLRKVESDSCDAPGAVNAEKFTE